MYTTLTLVALLAAISSAAPLRQRHNAPRQFAGSNSTSGRANPTYTQDQLDRIKLSLSAVDRYSYIESLGDTDL